MVLSKAVDVSVNSVKKEDIKECFGALYAKLGSSVDGNVMTLLGKTQQLIDTRFQELAEQRDLNNRLAALENIKAPKEVKTGGSNDMEDDILSATVIEVQKIEAENLKEAIAKMETDMEAYAKKMTALQAQLSDQKAAVVAEQGKFKSATEAL